MQPLRSEEQKKRDIANRRSFSFRLNIFFFLTFFVFSVLIVRLAVLQFVEGPELRAKVTSIGTRYVKIPPIRGNIYDLNSEPIAYSTSTQSLYYTIQPDTTEDSAREMARHLAAAFEELGNASKAMDGQDAASGSAGNSSGGEDGSSEANGASSEHLTAEKIYELMDIKGRITYVFEPRRIKAGVNEEEIAYFMENADLYPGVDIIEESIRHYSEDTVAVQLVGYMKGFNALYQEQNGLTKYQEIKQQNSTRDPVDQYLDKERVGYDGLELMYQDELRGKNGVKRYPVDSMNRIIGPMEFTAPEKGNNLFLTIDKNVQLRAEEAIMNHLEKIRTSSNPRERAKYARTGYAVAMEVKTGKVVAMASMPDYDPNVWQSTITKEQSEYLQYFINNGTIRTSMPYYEDPNEVKNHPSSLVYLGSTQKPLTVLLGLNEKLFTPQSTYYDRGAFYFGREGHKTSVSNAGNKANGLLRPWEAIKQSSNAFMSEMIGNRLYMKPGDEGLQIWDRYMEQFGLGVLTGSGLPNESKGVKDYFSESSGSAQAALVFASFGQQGRYTALQLAQYTTMLANRGKRMKPQFVNEIRDAKGNLVQGYTPEVLNEVDIPDAYWEVIERGMSQVSVQGFNGFPYSFNRKTGTSQQDVGKRKRVENAVFIAYAPADNPVLAVAVVVPDGGYGGLGAAPIARQIFDAYDDEIGLTGTPKNPTRKQSDGAADAGSAAGADGEQGTGGQQSTADGSANGQSTTNVPGTAGTASGQSAPGAQ
ncbi:peptidoglycan D,D-transpeptidase FtsI family protein [Paenibacillus sp. SYP-B4298]|uniref:peptidoglycan D,D-transpeptidase FtsI family protein n=1 Tax=Paenibacillus sp. SYP-B4298 TaxID=2996034 RepID=UPI0022DD0506|nr:penicillin-binding transpeptidase domain-containing protein [Paenibacillus sp. SYP-B4298]